mgnify:CR=1 FL=1
MNVECAEAAKNVNTNSGTLFLELLSHPNLEHHLAVLYTRYMVVDVAEKS